MGYKIHDLAHAHEITRAFTDCCGNCHRCELHSDENNDCAKLYRLAVQYTKTHHE